MLGKEFITSYAKENAIPLNGRRLLTEYLQSEILAILYNSKFGKNLAFLGGTCLRFAYKIDRFSEDLDFDLVGGEKVDFKELAKYSKKKLNELGFIVDIKLKKTEAIYILKISFEKILWQWGLSPLESQKVRIKFEIDPTPFKNIVYESKRVDAYGKSFPVLVNTRSTLFAQKLIALFFRPYQKGRDFYDSIWFLAQKKLEPNYDIFQEKGLRIKNRNQVAKELRKRVSKLDLKKAAKDVEKFLFYPAQAQWILDFEQYLNDWEGGEFKLKSVK